VTQIQKINAEYRIRTYVGTKPTAPKAAPFDHSGNSASMLDDGRAKEYWRHPATPHVFLRNLRYKKFYKISS
jgi:hypothetical protein